MTEEKKYLALADRCEKEALASHDSGIRKEFKELARQMRELAREARTLH
jgi:hypothetical protein